MLTTDQIQKNKDRFIQLLKKTDKDQNSIDNLISYLEKSSFFTDPSSSKYSGNYEGGLCEHALNVYDISISLAQTLDLFDNGLNEGVESVNDRGQATYTESNIIIASLLHCVYKIGLYQQAEKWYKNDSNRWCSYQGYEKNEQFPYGAGELSVEILRSFIKLTRSEMLAIRWCLGFYELGVMFPGASKFSFDNANTVCPLVTIIHTANYLASRVLEPTFKPTDVN